MCVRERESERQRQSRSWLKQRHQINKNREKVMQDFIKFLM